MNPMRNRNLRCFGLATLALTFLLCAGLPATAQDTPWSIGLGLSGTTADRQSAGAQDIDFGGIALFGRWQHPDSGWGAMAELRAGEDDESFATLDFGQINLYGTYTWRRDKVVRPFIKFGVSTTGIELADGANEEDTAGILGGGLEVGRGRWAFHFSIDGTEAQIDLIDPQEKTSFGSSTLGATFRF